MPYAKKTLSDLKQMLADKIASGVVPTSSATLAYWVRQINNGQQYCADRLKLTKSTSLTTVSGTIALPDDFISINNVIDSSDSPMSQINQELSDLAGAGQFWISGNHFDGFSLNTTADATYTVWYTFRPSEMSADADECIIPDPLAVVCYAYSKLRMAQTDPLNDADKEMSECNRRLDEVIAARNINDNDLRFSLSINA